MKKENWFRSLNLADDKYIAESNPDGKVKRFSRKRITVSVIATAACLALYFVNLWLFTPFGHTPPDVSRYHNSDYYGIIQKLNYLTWEKPKYNNNFQILKEKLSNLLGLAPMVPEWDEDMALDSSAGTYVEITDNQVDGIIEADRIKRSDKYIYYLDYHILRIYSIAGENSEELGAFHLYGFSDCLLSNWEFYLSEDCKTVTVITQFRDERNQICVGVIALDVSDPTNITPKGRFEITGRYTSSRMTDGKLLLLTEFSFNEKDINFDDVRTFLPQINTGSGMQTVPVSDIIAPEEINSTRYTVVMQLDENSLALEGTAACLSYSEDVHVSKDHIFLTRVFSEVKGYLKKVRDTMTEISCFTYGGNTIEKKGAVTVRGYVKDQWSMDEYEGILRMVTTTNVTNLDKTTYDNGSISEEILVKATGKSNASLYCVDLQSFQVVASVEDFAPPQEKVRSVRFDKDKAYVCTSIEMIDPVFFFDLSDLNNITYKDSGTIAGFSNSLVNFGNGKLLGIGRGGWNIFKVEIYEETENGVSGLSKYEMEDVLYSRLYKSYYIDRENQLVGFSMSDPNVTDRQPQRYVVLFFDGYDLVELLNVPFEGVVDFNRSVYIDGYMYLLGNYKLRVEKLFD